jgi:hypothetical protein
MDGCFFPSLSLSNCQTPPPSPLQPHAKTFPLVLRATLTDGVNLIPYINLLGVE